MKLTVEEIKVTIAEVIKASPEYMKKERVRDHLQKMIVDHVKAGKITTQEDLDGFFGAAEMSLKALKIVPLDVFLTMSKNKKR